MYESRGTLDRVLDAILGREIRKLNAHLPRKRRTLIELLASGDPSVETVDGTSIVLRKGELEELAKLIPQRYHDRLKLPIILLRRMDLGKSIYTVGGEPVEELAVRKILGETETDYPPMKKDDRPFLIYRPQVSELLRKFHSLFVIAFGVPRELSDYAPNRD
ncbi:MAG TPA: DUF61 family protein [Candidatus Acidoferrum sp.]|nr:DUF61 family protein [Candidatus Acidoferrum sp.]